MLPLGPWLSFSGLDESYRRRTCGVRLEKICWRRLIRLKFRSDNTPASGQPGSAAGTLIQTDVDTKDSIPSHFLSHSSGELKDGGPAGHRRRFSSPRAGLNHVFYSNYLRLTVMNGCTHVHNSICQTVCFMRTYGYCIGGSTVQLVAVCFLLLNAL